MSSKDEISVVSGDTLNIRMKNFYKYKSYIYHRDSDLKIIEDDNGKNIVSSDIRLLVKSTVDSTASIVIEKEAEGRNYKVARDRAEKINYNYVFNNGNLDLDAYMITDIDNKFSDQEVTIILYVPEGTILYADKNVRSYNNYYGNILRSANFGEYQEVYKDELKCLSCSEELESKTEDQEEATSFTNEEKPKLNIQVVEDGLNVEINDN